MDVNVPAAAEGRVALARSFAGAARRYWLIVFPRVCLELRRRRARALQIPSRCCAPPRSTPAQGGQRRGRGRVRRVRAARHRGGGVRDDVLPGRLQLPGHAWRAAERGTGGQRQAVAQRAARCAGPGSGSGSGPGLGRGGRFAPRGRLPAPRLLRAPPPAERRRLPDGDRQRLPRGARHTALIPDGRARGARGGRADRRVSERQHRRAIGRTRPERRGRPAGRPSGARALGPRADLRRRATCAGGRPRPPPAPRCASTR